MFYVVVFIYWWPRFRGSNRINSNSSENSYEENKAEPKKKRRKRKNKAQVGFDELEITFTCTLD